MTPNCCHIALPITIVWMASISQDGTELSSSVFRSLQTSSMVLPTLKAKLSMPDQGITGSRISASMSQSLVRSPLTGAPCPRQDPAAPKSLLPTGAGFLTLLSGCSMRNLTRLARKVGQDHSGRLSKNVSSEGYRSKRPLPSLAMQPDNRSMLLAYTDDFDSEAGGAGAVALRANFTT